MYTVKQASQRLGVSASLMYEWCKENRLPHSRYGRKGRRGKILIAPADLEAFAQKCRVTPAASVVEDLRHIQLPS